MKTDGITLEHAFVAVAGAYVAYKGLQGLGRLISSIPPEVWADAAAQMELNRLRESGDTEAIDALILSRLTRPLAIPVPLPSWLSPEEKSRLCWKIATELSSPITSGPTFEGITSLPIVGPVIESKAFQVSEAGVVTRRGKGGKKRISASLHPTSAPKLLAPAPQPAENKPASNNKKRRPGRTGMNVRTRKGLGFYDEVRVAGGTDQRAREVATNRLPVKRNLPMDEAVKRNRRAVDRAVREYRNNGDWDYPTT